MAGGNPECLEKLVRSDENHNAKKARSNAFKYRN